MAAHSCKLASWRVRLEDSLKRNSHLPYAKYFQVATVGVNERPANRTVVFRGFLDNSDDILFVTDERARKVAEVSMKPFAAVCWYFPESREQYRIDGRLEIVDSKHASKELLNARQHTWEGMSDAGRVQFAWSTPGTPKAAGEDAPVATPPAQENALETFCLAVLKVLEVLFWIPNA